MKKILRVSTALFLCFVMLLYTGPMQVAASGLAGTLYQIAGNIGVNAALRAIGVGPGNSPDAFNQLVTDATNNIFEGLSPLTQVFLDYTENGFRAFLSADFLANLLSFLFDSGTLVRASAPSSSPNNYGSMTYDQAYDLATSYPYGYLVTFSGSDRVLYISYLPVSWSLVDGKLSYSTEGYASGGSGLYRWVTYGSSTASYSYVSSKSGTFSSSGTVLSIGGGGVTTSIDLSLDSVSDSLSGSAYTDWSSAAQTIDEQQYFPVSIPSLSDSSAISTQTQAQAQAGTVPDSVADEIIAGADVVPETGTIADVITAVRALGADIVAAVQAIPAAIADIFSPAADPEVYQVDLKDFFPFCIPFDLFDIVTAFAAEPEAPVFEWPISVPRWGFEYTLKVDLQEWGDIASLFRTLELTIFCVGLAIVTREKFLRS